MSAARAVWRAAALVVLTGVVVFVYANIREFCHGDRFEATWARLRTINTAQASYHDAHGRYATSLRELRADRLIDERFASGQVGSSRIELLRADSDSFQARLHSSNFESAWFFVDQTGVIRFSTTGPATVTSTPIGG